jgi:hypothetical protein
MTTAATWSGAAFSMAFTATSRTSHATMAIAASELPAITQTTGSALATRSFA